MSDLNITIPLDCYLNTVLHDKHYAPVSPLEAEVIKLKTQNKHIAYIQEIDPNTGLPLPQPLVWRHHVYLQTAERWMELKRRSQLEREARFVLEENVLRLLRAIQREHCLEQNVARVLAYQHLAKKKFNLIKNYYNVKLVTDIKEIQ